MAKLSSQFAFLRQHFRALITVIKPRNIWEISVPAVLRTTFAQNSFVLIKAGRFYRLQDNGSSNNGAAFQLPSRRTVQLKQLRIKYHVHIVSNRYYEIRFPISQSRGLIKGVHDLTNFLLAVDQIMKKNL